MNEKLIRIEKSESNEVKPDVVEYKGYTLRRVGPFSNCYTVMNSQGEKRLFASLSYAKDFVDSSIEIAHTEAKNNLIATDSALYGKRLVKEIRSTLASGVGVYWTNSEFKTSPRLISAGFTPKLGGAIVIKTVGHGTFTLYANGWSFCDGYGRDICATRRLR